MQSLRLARRIVLGTADDEEIRAARNSCRDRRFQTDEELVKAAGNVGTTIFHPVGTCKMGRADDPSAVVDPQLRVRGIERPARDRRLDHADDHFGQHQFADADDRRARQCVSNS